MKRKMVHPLGDAPIEKKYLTQMNSLAQALQETLNGKGCRIQDSKVGFMLLVFEVGSGDRRANYISNSNREDVRALLKEQLARFDALAKKDAQ